MNKKIFIPVILLTIILFLGLGNEVFAANVGVIVVNGEGTVKVKPNIVEIGFVTETNNKDQGKAVEENAIKMNKLLNSLKKWGIEEEDIKTENVYISPIYNYEKGRELSHYVAENRITVVLRDIDRVGELIDLGAKSGADRVGSLRYTSTEVEAAYHQALALSVKDAKKKAESIAKELNVKINQPSKLKETSANYQRNSLNVYAEALADSGQDKSTPVTPKDIEVKASMRLEYGY